MVFTIENNGFYLYVTERNGDYIITSNPHNDLTPDLWNFNEDGCLKTKETNLYISVEGSDIYARPFEMGKVSQLWQYDRGRIFNSFNSSWLLGCNATHLMAGSLKSVPNAFTWKLNYVDQGDVDDNVDEDDFVIVPIPDCFDQNLPVRKEATKMVVVRNKGNSIDCSEVRKMDTIKPINSSDDKKDNINDEIIILSSLHNKSQISVNETSLSSDHINQTNNEEKMNNSDEIYDIVSSSDHLYEANSEKDDKKADEINHHFIDPFEDSYDSLEASTIRVLSSAFLMANKFIGKSISAAKDVFTSLQSTDSQAKNETGSDEYISSNKEPWCPPTNQWVPKKSTWTPQNNLWMPEDSNWMPEEGPWMPTTTPWEPKTNKWEPKQELWQPKQGQMEKLFEMGFLDKKRNQDVLDRCVDFDEAIELLANSEIK